MKKIILTAAAVMFVGIGMSFASNIIDEPPYEGQKCNVNGDNGRLFHHGKTNEANAGASAQVNAGGKVFGAKAEGSVSVQQKESYSGYKCHTENGQQSEQWDDGHVKRSRINYLPGKK